MPVLLLTDGTEAEAAARAVAFVEQETAGLDTELVHRVALAASEAVANAVEHGGFPVELGWEGDDDLGGWLTVSDAGGGPERDALMASTLPADARATTGRGLYLLRTLADTVGSRPGSVALRFVPRRTCA